MSRITILLAVVMLISLAIANSEFRRSLQEEGDEEYVLESETKTTTETETTTNSDGSAKTKTTTNTTVTNADGT